MTSIRLTSEQYEEKTCNSPRPDAPGPLSGRTVGAGEREAVRRVKDLLDLEEEEWR